MWAPLLGVVAVVTFLEKSKEAYAHGILHRGRGVGGAVHAEGPEPAVTLWGRKGDDTQPRSSAENLSLRIDFLGKQRDMSPFLNRRFCFLLSLENTCPGLTTAHLEIMETQKVQDAAAHTRTRALPHGPPAPPPTAAFGDASVMGSVVQAPTTLPQAGATARPIPTDVCAQNRVKRQDTGGGGGRGEALVAFGKPSSSRFETAAPSFSVSARDQGSAHRLHVASKEFYSFPYNFAQSLELVGGV